MHNFHHALWHTTSAVWGWKALHTPSRPGTRPFHTTSPHPPNPTADQQLSQISVHTHHDSQKRKFVPHHSKLSQMHLLTYTGSQSCCSGRKPSYTHKPGREQRDFGHVQHGLFYSLRNAGVYRHLCIPLYNNEVVLKWHSHLPFILSVKKILHTDFQRQVLQLFWNHPAHSSDSKKQSRTSFLPPSTDLCTSQQPVCRSTWLRWHL